MIYKLFIAGSGGQGVVSMGQMIAKAAMLEGKETTFYPAYGPEMRGGTANCTIIVSDKPISCPVIFEADAVVAMNRPSVTKFESLVKSDGQLFINRSLAPDEAPSGEYKIIDIKANDIAEEMGIAKAANMVMLGELIRGTGVVEEASIIKMLEQRFAGKEKVLELNKKAFLGDWK